MRRLRPAAALLAGALLAACGEGGPQDILGTLPGARVRFFNFGVNAPSVNFYGNDAKLTAIDRKNIRMIMSVEKAAGGPMSDYEHKAEEGWFYGA